MNDEFPGMGLVMALVFLALVFWLTSGAGP